MAVNDPGDDPNDPMVPVCLKINGVLDLHAFDPREVKLLVVDYLEECWSRGIYEVRIIHGKGSGTMRRTVHAVLERSPLVAAWRLADGAAGGWGATLVTLRRQ